MIDFLKLSSVWGVALTLAAFALGTFLHRKTKAAWCNPLLLGSIFVIVFLSVLKIPYPEYKGSASALTWLLFPATVSLAIPLYEQFELLKKNALAIAAGIISGVLTSVTLVLLFAVVFHFSHTEYVTFLPKSVTTAIGMGVSEQLGGNVSITVASIVITGVLGNILAEPVCRLLAITNPIARGIGIGSAAHAIGTAKAMELGEVEGAMSGLSIAVSGILTVFAAAVFGMLY